ncbi:MAG: hypothetical protein MUF29_03810, partial [Chitinophagaceae bacterium]|nr:hypothetical protein [Chitinophagaceae bacterium]
MRKLIFHLLLGASFLLMSSFECSKQEGLPQPAPIQASSYSPAIPVLKGLAANPVLRVAVTIPAGNAAQQFQKLHATINAEALSHISKLDV